ncbi:MAG: sel1 repeat family protein [Proteobacteria bacterium]|nr:sel1 repeat family protein [Pseudomonadota bacterium]
MSAPYPHEEERDERFRYAPRWVRETAAADPPAAPAMRMAEPEPAWPLVPARSEDERDADAAIRHLRLRRSLEPRPLPDPPQGDWRGLGMVLRLAGAIGAAAAVAVSVVYLVPGRPAAEIGVAEAGGTLANVSSWLFGPRQGGEAAAVPQPAARLVVEDRRGPMNQPLSLGIDLVGATGGAEIILSGLGDGSRLSTGSAIGDGGWRLAASRLAGAAIMPPKDFVGTMEVTVDLRGADQTSIDRNALRLEWLAPQAATRGPASARALAPAPRPTAVATASAPAVAAVGASPVPPADAKTEPMAPRQVRVESVPTRGSDLDSETIAMLLKRSEDFIASGDLAAARVLLRRVAEAGNGRAALALGATHDPIVLKQLGLVGIAPDIAQARAWYARAAELGASEGTRRIELLAAQATQTR